MSVTVGESISEEQLAELEALRNSLEDDDFSLPEVSDASAPALANTPAVMQPVVKSKPEKLTMAFIFAELEALRAQINGHGHKLAAHDDQLSQLKETKSTKPSYATRLEAITELKVYGTPNRRAIDQRGEWVTLNAVGQSVPEWKFLNELVKGGTSREEAIAKVRAEFKYPES